MLLFGARCEYERLLAVDREELGADRDELVDSTMRWSRYRGGSGESAILAFKVVIAWWLHAHQFCRQALTWQHCRGGDVLGCRGVSPLA